MTWNQGSETCGFLMLRSVTTSIFLVCLVMLPSRESWGSNLWSGYGKAEREQPESRGHEMTQQK